MHLIKRQTVEAFWKKHPDARAWLIAWIEVVRQARWRHLADIRTTYRDADEVLVDARRVYVFNVKGNKYRLITGMQPARPPKVNGTIFVKFFLTHAEYDKELWKSRIEVPS